MRFRALAGFAAAALLLAPAAALACPVCGAGATDRNNLAFLISTIFLSLLPLIAIAAGALWLRHRARAAHDPKPFDLETAAGAPRS